MIEPTTTAESTDGVYTSGRHVSFWTAKAEPLKYAPLIEPRTTDVVVVGGGLGGLTTAYCLLKSGKKVIVLEDGLLGSGETGRTTAHIVNALDDRYYHLESLYGEEDTRLIAHSHTAAIDFIEKTVNTERIECEFKRVNGYLFLHPSDKKESLQDEFESTQRMGLKTQLLGYVPGLPTENGPALQFENQGQFHPLKYLRGLANAIERMGGEIYTQTHVEKVESDGVTTRNGIKVTASHIVVATNTPINDMFAIHTKQAPYRTYVVAALIPKDSVQLGLWWDTGNMDSKWSMEPYHYIRVAEHTPEFDVLICGGEDHKTGQAEDENIPEEDRYKKLQEWMLLHFPMAQEILYKWSGQVMEPVDSLGFLGKNPGDENIYIITGDSGNGMTHCTIGGMLISDLINGITNPWEKIYDPSRKTLKAASTFIEENANVAKQYGDFVKGGDISSVDELMPGNGAILSDGLKKTAVYKDDDGTLFAYSAVCPHLGCVVQWNADEKSFDCPCHGSRFTCNGKVINGPAVSDLTSVSI
ncbi:MAG TPA: FAD-dependent oxidoreductase [Bacteroidia bacterium]|nr:FAD-dependent oxidoreductase [Bacteroidia bacterium]